MHTLNELFAQLKEKTNKHVMSGVTVGKVMENDDPEGIGCIQCEFPFNFPGSVHAAWLQPVWHGGGDVGFQPPEVGEYVLVAFVDGNLSDGFYFGVSRGIPKQKEVQKISEVLEAKLHAAIGERVDAALKEIIRYVRSHTHEVTVSGVSTYPGSPITLRGSTRTPTQSAPDLKTTRAMYVTFTKRNVSEDEI